MNLLPYKSINILILLSKLGRAYTKVLRMLDSWNQRISEKNFVLVGGD